MLPAELRNSIYELPGDYVVLAEREARTGISQASLLIERDRSQNKAPVAMMFAFQLVRISPSSGGAHETSDLRSRT
jgi:hypothetical protein